MSCECPDCVSLRPYSGPRDQAYEDWLELITSRPNICQDHNDQSPVLCQIKDARLDNETVISLTYRYETCRLRYTLLVDSQTHKIKGSQIMGYCSNDDQ